MSRVSVEAPGQAAREPYVEVPVAFLAQMGTMTDETLRLILGFYLAEHLADQQGVSVALGELAENCGLSRGRARVALAAMEEGGLVEQRGTVSWRLKTEIPEAPDYPTRG